MRETLAAMLGLAEDTPVFLQALTHPSYANEERLGVDNQRLEFLGDAILDLCTSELLYERFPEADEGQLTRYRAQLVNAKALARWGRSNGVPEALRMGKGARQSSLAESTNVLADAVEALIAAAYLSQGMEGARAFCLRIVGPPMEDLDQRRDPKSELQEQIQAGGYPAPSYQVLESGGPAHERWFICGVRVGQALIAQGRGKSKRQAERAAATMALDRWAQALTPNSKEELA